MSFINPNTENILVQYLDDTYAITLIQERPFFDRITKKSNMGGESAKVPLNIGYGGGQGGDFETALANAQSGGAKRVAFTVSPAKGFGITTLENSEVPFTQTPESAIDITTDATKGAMELAAQNFEAIVFGDGFGTLATILTATNTSGSLWTLVLTVPSDVNHFNMGNSLVSKATPASATLDNSGAAGVVTGLNQIGGSIQIDVASGGLVPTAGHVLGLQGQMAASTSVVTFPGIFGFVPPITSRTAGVIGDTFLGADRGVASSGVAVGGWAIDGRGKVIMPTVNALAGQMANLKNSKPDLLVCNPITLARMAVELDTKVRYDMPSRTSADVFFPGIEIMTPAGKVEAFAEAACPADKLVLTKASSWIYGYPDRPFQPTSLRGNIMTESYEHNRTRFSITCAGYFYTINPAATGVISISP